MNHVTLLAQTPHEQALEARLDKLESALEAALADNAHLRAALAPFAQAGAQVALTGQHTEITLYGPSGGFAKLDVADFQRALQALAMKY